MSQSREQTPAQSLNPSLRVALAHDWLTDYGGAERVLLEMHRVFPAAPVHTSLWRPEQMPADFAAMSVTPSFLQRLPAPLRRHRALLPLMPLAFEAFDLDGYDLVLSSSHACAKGVLTGPDTLHVSYLHSPMRYAWDMHHAYLQPLPAWKQMLARPLLHSLRNWDQLNTARIDHLLCNSAFVARRIQKYYRREATVIHPPVDVPEQLPPRRPADFYLAAGRLVPYKRVDLLIETFNANGLPLKVVGSGPESGRLRALAGPNIQFLGAVSRPELEALYASARALLFAPLEDFGIVPVEAQAYGCPVLAFGRGGARETVIDEVTGLFFAEQRVASLQQAIARSQTIDFDPQRLHAHARSFAAERFREQLLDYLRALLP